MPINFTWTYSEKVALQPAKFDFLAGEHIAGLACTLAGEAVTEPPASCAHTRSFIARPDTAEAKLIPENQKPSTPAPHRCGRPR
jgi:hypothetical protein